MTLSFRVLAACRGLLLLIASSVAVSGRPPMNASTISIDDVRRDDHLAALDDKASATTEQLVNLRTEVAELERESAERAGEERIVGSLVTLLSGGGLVLQMRGRKRERHAND